MPIIFPLFWPVEKKATKCALIFQKKSPLHIKVFSPLFISPSRIDCVSLWLKSIFEIMIHYNAHTRLICWDFNFRKIFFHLKFFNFQTWNFFKTFWQVLPSYPYEILYVGRKCERKLRLLTGKSINVIVNNIVKSDTCVLSLKFPVNFVRAHWERKTWRFCGTSIFHLMITNSIVLSSALLTKKNSIKQQSS